MPGSDRLKFEATTYREIATELAEIAKWLKSIGVRIASSRLEQYRRHLESIADAYDDGTIESVLLSEGPGHLIDSLFECTEFRTIHRALSGVEDPDLPRRLRDFVKGPAAYRDEIVNASSNQPRNIGFELYLGAHLVSAGLPVDFRPDGDLRFAHRGSEFFVECKRPQSANKLNSRAKGAFKKLLSRFSSSDDPERARGLVAISTTKLLNPKGKHLTTRSRATLDAGLRELTETFVQENVRLWRNAPDPRIIGFLLEFRCFSVVLSESMPTMGGDLVLIEPPSLLASDRPLLESFGSTLRAGIRP